MSMNVESLLGISCQKMLTYLLTAYKIKGTSNVKCGYKIWKYPLHIF